MISSWHIFESTKIGIPQLAHSPIIIIKSVHLRIKFFFKEMNFLQSNPVAVSCVLISKLFHPLVVLLEIALKAHKTKQSHNIQNGKKIHINLLIFSSSPILRRIGLVSFIPFGRRGKGERNNILLSYPFFLLFFLLSLRKGSERRKHEIVKLFMFQRKIKLISP